jgi:SAGA-associated factor 29
MSASAMIPIPPPTTTDLPKLEKGKTVLALYPDSTTFYKAEVTGMDTGTGNVNLRFEGEEQSGTQQVVERRFVVDYRD